MADHIVSSYDEELRSLARKVGAAELGIESAALHLGKIVEEGPTNFMFTNPSDTRTQDTIRGRFG